MHPTLSDIAKLAADGHTAVDAQTGQGKVINTHAGAGVERAFVPAARTTRSASTIAPRRRRGATPRSA